MPRSELCLSLLPWKRNTAFPPVSICNMVCRPAAIAWEGVADVHLSFLGQHPSQSLGCADVRVCACACVYASCTQDNRQQHRTQSMDGQASPRLDLSWVAAATVHVPAGSASQVRQGPGWWWWWWMSFSGRADGLNTQMEQAEGEGGGWAPGRDMILDHGNLRRYPYFERRELTEPKDTVAVNRIKVKLNMDLIVSNVAQASPLLIQTYQNRILLLLLVVVVVLLLLPLLLLLHLLFSPNTVTLDRR